MGVTTASSVLKFTLKELEVLVNDVDSQVYLKKDVKYPLKLTPSCLQNVNQAITEILNEERLKYLPAYKGLLLSFKNVRRHSNMGTINDDECNILIHIHVDLYIFAPEIGCTMTGIVSKRSEDNVGCLVHKGFNVTLPRPRKNADAVWLGNSVCLGDEVKFQLDSFNVVGTLPYIRGTLLSHKKVKQESGLSKFLWGEDELLPPKQEPKAGKRKKLTSETDESDTLKGELLKKPSKKKKVHSQDDVEQSNMDEPVPDLLEARKERKREKKRLKELEAAASGSDIGNAKHKQKRKIGPIAGPSTDPIPQDFTEMLETFQDSAKKRKTSTSDEIEGLADNKKESATKSSLKDSKVIRKKSKSANPNQDLTTDDNIDISVDALMRNAIKNIGGETKKSKLRLSKSSPVDHVGGDNSDGYEKKLKSAKKAAATGAVPRKSLVLEHVDEDGNDFEKEEQKPVHHVGGENSVNYEKKAKSAKKAAAAAAVPRKSLLLELMDEDGADFEKEERGKKSLPVHHVGENSVNNEKKAKSAKKAVAAAADGNDFEKQERKKKSLPIQHVGGENSVSYEKEAKLTKSAKKAAATAAVPRKSLLLELMDEDEDDFEKERQKKNVTVKPSPIKKKNKSILSVAKIDSTAGETLGGATKKTSGSPRKPVLQLMSGDDSDNLATENYKGTKRNKLSMDCSVTSSASKVSKSISKKKNKLKPTEKEDLATDYVGDVSIEELMAKALENVSDTKPKTKKSKGLRLEDPPLVKSSKKSKKVEKSALADEEDWNLSAIEHTPTKIRKTSLQSPIGVVPNSSLSKKSKTPKIKTSTSAVTTPFPNLPPLPSLDLLSAQTPNKTGSKKDSHVKKLRESMPFDMVESSSSNNSSKKKKKSKKSSDMGDDQ